MRTKSAGREKPEFPKPVTTREYPGITATIYRDKPKVKTDKDGNEREYVSYTLAYTLLGKRERKTFAELTEAEAAGKDAITKIANGDSAALELRNGDRYE